MNETQPFKCDNPFCPRHGSLRDGEGEHIPIIKSDFIVMERDEIENIIEGEGKVE